MTPFLWLVVAGYAVFILTLGSVSIWTWLPERKRQRAKAVDKSRDTRARRRDGFFQA